MPRFVLSGWTLTTTEGTRTPLRFNVHNESLRTADRLEFNLAVTAVLRAAWNAKNRRIGLLIEADKGTGTLETLTLAEIGPGVTISGSLDGYGSRTLSFKRLGAELSPLRSWILGSQKAVRVTGYLGVPGAIQSRVLFNGYTRVGSFTDYPPSADVECQDSSLAFANTMLALNIENGEGNTRKDVVVGVLDSTAIPYGELDFGPGEGGRMYKGVTVGGDMPVLGWLEQYLTPIARRCYWRDGKLHIRRISTSGPVQRTLGAADGIRVSLGIPAANDENAVTVSSALYGYQGASGLRTETTIRTQQGVYAPLVATSKQACATGVISALTLSSSAVSREISRVVTKTTYDGDTPVWWEIEEWGWYAPRACNKWQAAGGAISHNPDFDVFQFADGSWRTEQEESFRVLRVTQTVRTWSETMIGIGYPLDEENTRVTEWYPRTTHISYADETTAEEIIVAGYRTDDGRSWSGGAEAFTFSNKKRTHYTATEDGQLHEVYTTATGPSENIKTITTQPTLAELTAYLTGVWYAYGPTETKKWVRVENDSWEPAFWAQTISYVSAVENTYQQSTTHSFYYLDAGFFSVNPVPSPPASRTETLPGSIPYVPMLVSSYSEPQGATATMTDDPRIALAQRVDGTYSNDYCETLGELETVALERLREVGHVPVSITMPVDFSIDEGDVIVLDYSPVTAAAMTLVVWSINWTFNLATGANEQTLDCRYYPPAIAPN